MPISNEDAVHGVVLGTAIGDALGLPWEGMAAPRIARLAPIALDYQQLGCGYISDDTEHTVLVARALADAGGDIDQFENHLAWGLRWWLWSLPPGIGFGTLRSLIWLSLGVRPSGVNSAGNGAAMRAALLGIMVSKNELAAWVRVGSEITHCDLRAVEGAHVIALAAQIGQEYGHAQKRNHTKLLLDCVSSPDLHANLLVAIKGYLDPASVARDIGAQNFVTGFVNQTVPIAIAVWLCHDNYEGTVEHAIRLGGDTDTVAAIAGALCGATGGGGAIPLHLQAGLDDQILNLKTLQATATGLSANSSAAMPVVGGTRSLLRNLAVLPRFIWHIIARQFR